VLSDGKLPGILLHLLGNQPATLCVGRVGAHSAGRGRSALVMRRRSGDGAPLSTRFVTLFEPIVAGGPRALRRVGRIDSSSDCVVVAVETALGREYTVINTRPGSAQTIPLEDNQVMRTDAFVVHAGRHGLTQAGGTYCEFMHLRSTAPAQSGVLVAAEREGSGSWSGWFDAARAIEQPETAAGKTLIVRHGDGSAWTIERISAGAYAAARIEVSELPGFTIDAETGDAVYYQHPRIRAPGPHLFRVCGLSRSGERSPQTPGAAVAR
jgi:hypothetical protein